MEPEYYRFDESDHPKRSAYHVLLDNRLALNLCLNDRDEVIAACREERECNVKEPACSCGHYWDAKAEGYSVSLSSLKIVHDQTADTYVIRHDNRVISRDAQFSRWLVPRLKERGFTDTSLEKKAFTIDYLWYLFFSIIYIGIMYEFAETMRAKPHLQFVACLFGIVALGALFYFSLRPNRHKRIVYQAAKKEKP